MPIILVWHAGSREEAGRMTTETDPRPRCNKNPQGTYHSWNREGLPPADVTMTCALCGESYVYTIKEVIQPNYRTLNSS